jgi:hypothetical protein
MPDLSVVTMYPRGKHIENKENENNDYIGLLHDDKSCSLRTNSILYMSGSRVIRQMRGSIRDEVT